MKFFEDLRVGERYELGSHTFAVEEIKAFAARFDPQPFHLDEAAAARSHFGRLCASGWHTVATWMRHLVLYRQREAELQRAKGEPVAEIGPSPGFRDLNWLKPVYAGDTITFATEIIETRPLQSKPKWGLMTGHHTGTNQAGELVLAFVSSAFVERRDAR